MQAPVIGRLCRCIVFFVSQFGVIPKRSSFVLDALYAFVAAS